MKKITKIFFAGLLSVGFGVAAQAQNTSESITVGATVVDELKITPGDNLQFGMVTQGIKKRVMPNDDVVLSNSQTAGAGGLTPTSGKFVVNAQAGSNVTLEFTAIPTALNGPSSATMPIKFNTDFDGTTELVTVGYGASTASITKIG